MIWIGTILCVILGWALIAAVAKSFMPMDEPK
jgi:hypothetical protein